MRKLLLVLLVFALVKSSEAQILKRIADRAKQKMEQKVDEKVDKSIDKQLDGKDGTKAKADDNNDAVQTKNTDSKENGSETVTALAYTSKYDFIQGEKVVAYEDFNNEAIGEFPKRWNTNGNAEVVTNNLKEGKWLKISTEGKFLPEFITDIPENSTLEFDLGVNNNFDWGNNNIHFYITHFDNRAKFYDYNPNPKLHFEMHPIRGKEYTGQIDYASETTDGTMRNNGYAPHWDNKKNLFAHVSIWRQGQRIRLYVNGDKAFDIPRAYQAGAKYDALLFETNGFQSNKQDYWLLGNIRVAAGAPDTRNKLITEGKFVTSGILFDVNSDKIKPESNGVLKEIASVLSENPSIKVKIIGHTDADGDATKNLDLSKRRAASVKTALSTDFNIDAARMDTDGMGATKPVADNKTTEGKAQNRRVEFIKN